ncbi:hypothetical protein SeGA_6089, partial [Salmonella enterica subsp. enterica serovar Gaminara str. A4-567]
MSEALFLSMYRHILWPDFWLINFILVNQCRGAGIYVL